MNVSTITNIFLLVSRNFTDISYLTQNNRKVDTAMLNSILQVLKIDANSETLCRFDTDKFKRLFTFERNKLVA